MVLTSESFMGRWPRSPAVPSCSWASQGRGELVSASWHPLSPEPTPAAEASLKVQNVEDFVPEDSLDRSFLEDTVPAKDEKRLGARGPQDSDR